MEPNTSGAGPVGNKRNSVKKLLDAYHDLMGGYDQPGQDGQGGPGFPSPVGGVPQKPMLPGMGGGPVPQGGAQMPQMPKPQMGAVSMPKTPPPAPTAAPQQQPPVPGLGAPMGNPWTPTMPTLPSGPLPMPQMGQVSMPPTPGASSSGPMPTSMPLPQAPNQGPLPTSMPAKPGMGSNPSVDMESLKAKMSGSGQMPPGGQMNSPMGQVGSAAAMGAGALAPGVAAAVKGVGPASEVGGNILKTITDHLAKSRDSHMSHEKEILQKVLDAQKERVQNGGSPVPPSMAGHEQDYFDQTSGYTPKKLNMKSPKKSPSKVASKTKNTQSA